MRENAGDKHQDQLANVVSEDFNANSKDADSTTSIKSRVPPIETVFSPRKINKHNDHFQTTSRST